MMKQWILMLIPVLIGHSLFVLIITAPPQCSNHLMVCLGIWIPPMDNSASEHKDQLHICHKNHLLVNYHLQSFPLLHTNIIFTPTIISLLKLFVKSILFNLLSHCPNVLEDIILQTVLVAGFCHRPTLKKAWLSIHYEGLYSRLVTES